MESTKDASKTSTGRGRPSSMKSTRTGDVGLIGLEQHRIGLTPGDDVYSFSSEVALSYVDATVDATVDADWALSGRGKGAAAPAPGKPARAWSIPNVGLPRSSSTRSKRRQSSPTRLRGERRRADRRPSDRSDPKVPRPRAISDRTR